MSIKVITWVMSDADVQNHGELAVLYALAERAHEDGRYAWPSQAWIAYRARCTARTVRNHLTNLEDRGVIVRGDQQVVSHLDPRYRPVVWDIDMTKVRDDPSPERLSSLAKSRAESFAARAENPDTQGGKSEQLGRKPVSYKPSLEPSSEPSKNLTPCSPPPGGRDFERFWSIVPKKAKKRKAEEAFRKAVKRADPETIIAGMRRYANDPNLPDPKGPEARYILHPATWLNGDCWEDDPLPDRGGSSSTGDNSVEAWLGIPKSTDPFDIVEGEVVETKELWP